MSVECSICNKEFSARYNLNKHLKKVHDKEPEIRAFPKDVFKYKCMEDCCEKSFRNCSDFVRHLELEHKFKIEREELKFQSFEEFSGWKEDVEISENCAYAMSRGTRNLPEGREVTNYVCNRSVKQRRKLPEDRPRKRNRLSFKLSLHCTSQMTVEKVESEIFVRRIKNHYGHSTDDTSLKVRRNYKRKPKQQIEDAEIKSEKNEDPDDPEQPKVFQETVAVEGNIIENVFVECDNTNADLKEKSLYISELDVQGIILHKLSNIQTKISLNCNTINDNVLRTVLAKLCEIEGLLNLPETVYKVVLMNDHS